MEPIPSSTVAAAFMARATTAPQSEYIRTAESVVTVGEIDSMAEALAAALAGLGVGAGDRVAIVLPARTEFVVSVLAAAKLGASIVPLHPRLTSAELQYALRHSGAACAVAIERFGGVDFLQLFEHFMPQLPDLQYVVTVGEEDLWYDDRIFQFEDLISSGAGRDYPTGAIDPGGCFALVYTSGTSGKPKGVELTHSNLLSTARATADALGLDAADRLIGFSALSHVFGLVTGMLGGLLAGSCLVLLEEPDPGATLDAIAQHRATVHFGIPTLFVAELAHLERRAFDLSSLRLAVLAGAPVHDDLVARVSDRFGVPAVVGYSLTETSSTVCVGRPDDTDAARRFTVGVPLAGTEIRVADTRSGHEGEVLPAESVGEIRVRGPGVMLGYFRQPSETRASVDEDGFFRTGDLGIVDEDGRIHLVGRIKDVIIRSGFNVYPREVEARIESHPAVQEAAVVGLHDPLLGEAVCACVVPVEGAIVTAHEIVDWCRETLAGDKVPDRVRFVDGLPRTSTGQVRRVEVARTAEADEHEA